MKNIFKKHMIAALVFAALTALGGCAKRSYEKPPFSQTTTSASTQSAASSSQPTASASTESTASSSQSTTSASTESASSSSQSTASASTESIVLTSSDNSDLTSKTIYELYGDIKVGGNADKIIIVGDSRVEIMAIDYRYGNMERNPKGFYCGNFNGALSGDYVLAQGGAMFDWMDENITRIDEWIDEGTAIVIAMGVNGCQTLKKQDDTGYESLDEFADRYSSLYGNWIVQKSKEWKEKGAITYFVSVNPVDEVCAGSWGYNMKNSEIEAFNKRMKKIISDYDIGYIDTYSEVYNWVTKLHETCGFYQSGTYKGKLLSDGVHYDQSSIADKIWSVVKGKPPVT